MFVYVLNNKIVLKSKERIVEMLPQYKEYQVNYTETDRLIFEDNQIKLYENSKQYLEDINYYHLQTENEKLKKENKQLEFIAHEKIQEDREMFTTDKPNDYQKKIYLLKKIKCSRQLSWQGVE